MNNYENFDSMETNSRKSALIQERVNLVSSHMYKQFLDYSHATVNTNKIFALMNDNLSEIVETLKDGFSSRGVTTQNIYLETDIQKTVTVVNILWQKMSFTTRCNFQPQALYREVGPHIFSGRIMAIKGNYNDIMAGVTNHDDEMERLLENEIASLYIPAEINQNAVMKVKHLSSREFLLNPVDAPREFPLKVVETVCGGGLYHVEGSRKSFNL